VRILADENVPLQTVQALRELGHDVRDVRGTPDEGISDDRLWQIAMREGRLLISTDRGFAERRGENHYGILLVCLHQPNRQKIHDRVMEGVREVAEADWPGLLLTMRDNVRGIWRRAE
jgi:predicted nuclease of predicted toxin-antitoxin system